MYARCDGELTTVDGQLNCTQWVMVDPFVVESSPVTLEDTQALTPGIFMVFVIAFGVQQVRRLLEVNASRHN